MVRPLIRASPLLAFAIGSWIGVGHPLAAPMPVQAPSLLSPRAFSSVAFRERATAPPAGVAPPPQERAFAIDGALMPDPTPWPDLNPQGTVSRAWLLAEGPAFSPESGRRVVTFTFDDGPFPETTPVVLKVLAKHDVRATFFWIGRYLDGDGERARATRRTALAVRDAGHLVGNHTHDHVRLTTLDHADALAEIEDGAQSIERAIGLRPCLFRPPFGQVDDYTERAVRAQNLTVVLWNMEVEDLQRTDAEAMADSLETQIEFSGGGIVLLHDIRFTTADTLEKVLTWLDKRRYDPARPDVVGYEVVDFTEFMRTTASSPQPFPTRRALEEARAAAWRKAHPRSPLASNLPSEDAEAM